MVAVSALYLFAALQVDAQRGAEERGFDVMRDDGVAAKDDLYVVVPDQVNDVAARAGVYDCRAKHKEKLAVANARASRSLARSNGMTRIPSCPMTTSSPTSTSCIGLQKARLWARSITTATSISICSTSTH